MIKINLLPPGRRPSAARALILTLPWRKIGLGAGGFLLVVSAWLLAANAVQSRRFAKLSAEWQALEPQRNRLAQVEASLTELKRRAAVLDALKAPPARWAPRLNLLSDCLVVDLWFDHLRFGSSEEPAGSAGGPPMLDLTGFSLVMPQADQSAAPVSRFLKKIKEHPEFQNLFVKAELVALKHRQIGKEEVSEFSLLFQPTGQ